MKWTRLVAMWMVAAIALAGAPSFEPAHAATLATVDLQLKAALAQASGPVAAIVTFQGDGPPTAVQVDLLRQVGITTGVTLRSLPMAGALVTADQVNALAASPEVRSIFFNAPLTYDNAEATELTGVKKVRTDPKLTLHNGGVPITGKGVGIVVNDSGIDATHKDLEFGTHVVQNVVSSTNLNALEPSLLPIVYIENVPNTDATGGHGTHVAGIVGATGAMSAGKYEGVAPGASLVGYGSGLALALLDVLGGFDYALTNQTRYGIRVITNSWGTTSDACTPVDPNDPINVATKRLVDRNIVVVFSAGNAGPAQCTITGNYKKAPWVIAVAAGDKQRGLADFSSRGMPGGGGSFVMDGKTWTWEDRPTLTAPGVKIISTRNLSPVGVLGTPDDLELIEPAFLPFYTTLSGTSMAAPHVAGIVALMLEANPRLTPLQIKQILQDTATPMSGYQTWEVGAGYVDAYAAVQRAVKTRVR